MRYIIKKEMSDFVGCFHCATMKPSNVSRLVDGFFSLSLCGKVPAAILRCGCGELF